MKLEDIGFYTLTDERAANTCKDSRLSRCELILTDVCNFKCPYCDKKSNNSGAMSNHISVCQKYLNNVGTHHQ